MHYLVLLLSFAKGATIKLYNRLFSMLWSVLDWEEELHLWSLELGRCTPCIALTLWLSGSSFQSLNLSIDKMPMVKCNSLISL